LKDKNEHRLKSKALIDKIFINGNSEFKYPLKLCYLIADSPVDQVQFKFGVSVSKRNYKKAVDRNKIKRLLRESIASFKFSERKIKKDTYYYMLIIYVGKKILHFEIIEKAVHKILGKLINNS
jgi:ribonuclease P protein component